MTIIDREDQLLQRDEWLADRDLTEGDVMEDGGGREYVMDAIEHEDMTADFSRVFLPEELQTLNYPF